MNYKLYKEWLKLRQEGKVPPSNDNPVTEDRGTPHDYQASMRDGSA